MAERKESKSSRALIIAILAAISAFLGVLIKDALDWPDWSASLILMPIMFVMITFEQRINTRKDQD